MKTILFLILCTLLFFNCSGEDTSPKKIMPEDIPLIDQIADLYFMDIWLSRIREGDRDSIRVELNKQFVELHGVEAKQLKSTLKDLENEPKRYGLIMDSVIIILKNTQSIATDNKK